MRVCMYAYISGYICILLPLSFNSLFKDQFTRRMKYELPLPKPRASWEETDQITASRLDQIMLEFLRNISLV